MTGAEWLEQRGIQIGSQLGQAGMLLDLLQLKFGNLSPSYTEMVKKANLGQLSEWSKKILAANSLQQIFSEDLVN